jgi:hypothetical protein
MSTYAISRWNESIPILGKPRTLEATILEVKKKERLWFEIREMFFSMRYDGALNMCTCRPTIFSAKLFDSKLIQIKDDEFQFNDCQLQSNNRKIHGKKRMK